MVDDWNNGIAGTTTAVRWDSAGTLYSGAALGSTRPAELASSLVGNEVGFQAHLHDSDAGLILMRARVFDPTTGMFLQPDPEGHLDSVNQYAGMGWDPVNLRDPTGMNAEAQAALERCLQFLAANPASGLSEAFCYAILLVTTGSPFRRRFFQRPVELRRRRWRTRSQRQRNSLQ